MADEIKALIIEDDAVVSKVLATYLGSLGLVPTVVEDVLSGLQALADQPDMTVAFIDLNLEPYSGYAFLRALGREEKYNDLKKVMVTGEAKKMAVQAAIHDGARAYILKPVNLDQLKNCLTEIGVPFTESESEEPDAEATSGEPAAEEAEANAEVESEAEANAEESA